MYPLFRDLAARMRRAIEQRDEPPGRLSARQLFRN
jgi:hypothetical protein